MKAKMVMLLCSVMLGGCVGFQQRHRLPGGVQRAYVQVRTDNYQDGTSVKRVYLWADGRWWEVFRKDLSK